MQIAIVICSVGRPKALAALLPWIARQTKLPSQVLLVVTGPQDLPDAAALDICLNLRVAFSAKGLARQRNLALDQLRGVCDAIFFIDDDYLPARTALAGIEASMNAFPKAAGFSGRLIADGIHRGGVSMEDAATLVRKFEDQDNPPHPASALRRGMVGLYGCNMAIRCSAIGSTRFDEALPLYGWQEDVDFTARLTGEKIRMDAFAGVHCGLQSGRETGGYLLGYSQIANPLYLWRKGSVPRRFILRLLGRNILANHLRLLAPEPWIDRRGRARGNWLAIRDAIAGRLHPTRILEFGHQR